MKVLGKYWKLLIALILVGAAVFLFFNTYRTEKLAHEVQLAQMETMIEALNKKIAKDIAYEDIQPLLEGQVEQLNASRLDLYKRFPTEMKEEDQIMYLLYLESLFGTEIRTEIDTEKGKQLGFKFSRAVPLAQMSDGAQLNGLLLEVNYSTTYKGFQEMVDYLATDSRIVSIYEATISYNKWRDIASGDMKLLIYLVDGYEGAEYVAPDIAIPETGKENIFG